MTCCLSLARHTLITPSEHHPPPTDLSPRHTPARGCVVTQSVGMACPFGRTWVASS